MVNKKIIQKSIFLTVAVMISSVFAGTNGVSPELQNISTKVTKIGAIKLVSKLYQGDGQYEYFILTSDGKTINTNNILPKSSAKINPNDKKNLPLIMHMGPPQVLRSQQQITLIFPMQTRSCVACAPISSYKVQYKFNKAGKLDAITQIPSS